MRQTGQVYRNKRNGRVYLLAQVDTNMVTLLSLASGNRWSTPCRVSDVEKITAEEWKKITGPNVFNRQLALERLFGHR